MSKLPISVKNQLSSTLISTTYEIDKWSRDEITALLSDPLGPPSSIPIRCRGKGKCPMRESCFIEDDSEFIGGLCPIERRFLGQLFFAYAAHLSVGPTDYTDITMIWHLVRLTMQARRLDTHLQNEDIISTVIVGIDPNTGRVLENKIIHPAVGGQESALKKTMEVMAKMIATRKDRLDAASKSGNSGFDPLVIMSQGRKKAALKGVEE